jgi:hypothetical protein
MAHPKGLVLAKHEVVRLGMDWSPAMGWVGW